MTDKKAFLAILSMVIDSFPPDRGYDAEWVSNVSVTYFKLYKRNVAENNIPSSYDDLPSGKF